MKKLDANRFALAEYKFNEWSVVLEFGTQLDDVFQPDFWAHVAKDLKQGDIVHVRSEDSSVYARLYVRASDRLWAKMGKIEVVQFDAPQTQPDEDGLQVKWIVGKRCFAVVRKADNQVIQGGFQIKEDAVAWMQNHNKQLAA